MHIIMISAPDLPDLQAGKQMEIAKIQCRSPFRLDATRRASNSKLKLKYNAISMPVLVVFFTVLYYNTYNNTDFTFMRTKYIGCSKANREDLDM
jgi:hypothetical protein